VAEEGRLGRGLAALLGDAGTAPAHALVEVDIDDVRPNPDQPRRAMDEAGLQALAASLRSSGVVQPVVVRALEGPEDGARWELIAGERRWRAARLAGLQRLPALVRDAGERERLELALVENMVREDLNPIEAARACAVLVEDLGQTHAALAERLGRSRPAITNLLRLLELPDDVQAAVGRGELSEGHARAVLMAKGARARRRVAERAVAQGLSVRATETLARRGPSRARVGRDEPPPPLADEALEAFYAAFGAPVRVRAGRGEEVRVELRFPDEEALRRALGRLPRPAG
jgi:ParB family chromosome partitioning protein